MIRPLLLWLFLSASLVADGPFTTTIETQSVEAITAKAASVEPLSDRVAVILIEADEGKRHGISIQVTTDAKFVTVRARQVGGARVTVRQSQSGRYLLFGAPGKYELEVASYDPEKGIGFDDYEVVIQGPVAPVPPKPDQPTPPPVNGFERVREVTKLESGKLNDPATAKLLSTAYRNAVAMMAGKSFEDCKTIAIAARRAALQARQGKSRLIDWNTFLYQVEGEVLKVATTADAYRAALVVISEALDS